MKKVSECLQKAYELRERASERERLYILGITYGESTGEIAKQVEVYEEWNRTYPSRLCPRSTICPWSTSGLVSLKKL